MTLDIASVLGYVVLPLVTAIVSYVLQGINKRMNYIEERIQKTTTEPQVRQLISDRYDPLAADIRDIKEKLDKLFDLYLKESR